MRWYGRKKLDSILRVQLRGDVLLREFGLDEHAVESEIAENGTK